MLNAPAHRRPAPRRRINAVLGGAVALLLMLGGVLSGALVGSANNANATITNLQVNPSEAEYGETVGLSFNWSVPDSARSGDQFRLTLPAEISPRSTANFFLRTGSDLVATAVWSGNTAVFTLEPFVDTVSNVRGNAHFNVSWSRSLGNDVLPVRLDFTGDVSGPNPTLTFKPTASNPSTGWGDDKVGGWLDSKQGSESLVKQLGWAIYVSTGTANGTPAPLVIEDTFGSNWTLHPGSVQGFFENGTPLPASRYSVNGTATGMTITLVGNYPNEPAVYAGESIYFTYEGDLLPGNNGIFENKATITHSDASVPVSAEILTDAAGGSGVGTRSVSVGDFVWLDANGDGVQNAGEAGIPGVKLTVSGPNGQVTDVDGNLVGAQITNQNGQYLFTGLPALQPGEVYTVSIDKDDAANVAALEGLLPTEAGQGGNPELDSSTWAATSKSLTQNGTRDLSLDFGFVRAPVIVPAVPVDPAVAVGVCNQDGSASAPTVTLPTTTGLSYTIEGAVTTGSTIVVTATPQTGYSVDSAALPSGWAMNPNGSASVSIVLPVAQCDQPVVPVMPTVTQAVCNADGTSTAPTVVLADTPGVVYALTGTVAAGESVVVSATAQSGFLFNPGAVPAGWTLTDGVLSTTVVLDAVVCDQPVVPVAPTVTQAVCNADGTSTVPTVVLADTPGVVYALTGTVAAGESVVVSATAQTGFLFNPGAVPAGWTLTDGVLSTTVVLDAVVCDQPVVPVAPTVTQAVCNADGTSTVPTVVLADTPGVVYALMGKVAPGETVRVVATVAHGFFFDDLPDGWTVLPNDDFEFVVKLASVDCVKPVVPSPDAPKSDVPSPSAPKAGELPFTGVEPLPMIMGGALLLLVGVAVLGVNRRRQLKR